MITRRLFLQGVAATAAVLPFLGFAKANIIKPVTKLPDNLFLDSKNYIIMAPRRAGKTYAMAQGAIQYCLNNPNSEVLFYSYNHTMSGASYKLAWDLCTKSTRLPISVASFVGKNHHIIFNNDSKITFTPPQSYGSFYGVSTDLIIHDELSVFDKEAAENALTLSKLNNSSKTIIITTPTSTRSPSYEIWKDAVKGTNNFIPIRWVNPENQYYKFWKRWKFIPLKWS